MPILNLDKCYIQQPKRLEITVPTTFPDNWLTEFYALLSEQLRLDDKKKQEVFDPQTNQIVQLTEKEQFYKELEQHLGPQSTYSLKFELQASFGTLYVLFTHPKTTHGQKELIASTIKEGVSKCSPGLSDRVNFTITRFNIPQNRAELIAQVRFKLVDEIANIIAGKNAQSIHVHNRVIELAQRAGFGVWSINTNDFYIREGSQNISDEDIVQRIKTWFANHFQLFALVNALRDQLEALIVQYRYDGKRDLEHDYKLEAYEKFYESINRFIRISMEELLETDTKLDKVTDINWQYVKRQLLQQLRDENYVMLSQEESVLLDGLLLDENRPLDLITLNTLIPHVYELVQCLEFFSEWNMQQKAALVVAYLNHQSPHDQKEVLAILYNEAPQLTAQLKKEPNLQAIYFAIAIAEKDVVSVRAYIEQGKDINEALLLLFSPAHKSDTLYWLHEHPHLLQQMTVAGMNTVIEAGKYQGKTFAETLVSTKKGRQLLLENRLLQILFDQTTMAKTLADSLQQADTERKTVSTQEGFFKKFSPLTIELVQAVVYGDLRKSKALLQGNPALLKTLLTEKVTVIDYSRRKVKQKTAFQAALCAMDDELCAMLAKYMPKEEMVRQYQAIFPEGHKAYSQEQTPFNFSLIVDAISESSDADVEKALSLELPNDTSIWKNLDQLGGEFHETLIPRDGI